MNRYKAVLFAPDGDWVTDYKANTKVEVISKLADGGSKWYFYPFEGLILDKGALTSGTQRLLDVAPNLPRELVGKSIRTMSRWIAHQSQPELDQLLA